MQQLLLCTAQEATASWEESVGSGAKQIRVQFPLLTLHLCNHQDLWWFWDFILLASYQVSLPHFFHGCWQKTWDSWVSNSSSQSISFFLCQFPLPPSLIGATQKGPGDTCTCSGLCYRRATLSLMSLNLLWWAVSLPFHCSTGRHCVFQSCSLYRYPWKHSPEPCQSVSLFTRCAKTWEIHGKLSHNNDH